MTSAGLNFVDPPPRGLPSRLRVFASDIKIQHTVFAMPWALLSAVLAGKTYPNSWVWGKLGLIILCMITARTVAMSANRLLDAALDARNPRTARRAIPAGLLSRRFFFAVLVICCLIFVASTGLFEILYRNPWPLILALPVLAFLSAYPLIKRFSELCHYYLGMALALAPVCAWLAIAGRMNWPPIIMFAAVLSWTAGFDIIYACQDFESDSQTGVFSVPAKLGIANALRLSRATHLFSAIMIVLLGVLTPAFSWLYAIGAFAAILLLIVEQSLVSPTDLSKANLAFFTTNGIISVVLGTLGIIDLLR
ncbi:MAG: UbiA-like polyprenyltransferase [Tepidisphaeraceae bacterium]|jgi:4-hydroxybenzoate polyprenyltransferase